VTRCLFLGLASLLVSWGIAPGIVQAQTRTVVDPDSVVAFDVPESWIPAPLDNSDASVILSDPAEEVFFMVIGEHKDALYGWNLTRAEYVTVGQTVGALDLPEVDEPVRFTLDGAPAVRYDIRGATGGVQLAYMKVTIDAPAALIQLIGWTGRSAWAARGSTLERVVGSATLLPSEGG